MAFSQTAKQVTASINKIDGRALRGAIQQACLQVIGHAMEFGHSPLANALDDRFTASPMMRKHAPAVQKFLTSHGPFNYSKDTGYVFSKAKRAEFADGYNFDDFAEDAPMWDEAAKAERKVTDFDLFKEVEKLVARAIKKSIEGACTESDMIPTLQAALGHYAGAKIVAAAKAKEAAESAARTEAIRAELDAADAGPEVVAVDAETVEA